jgi:DNA-binding NarL/FixJ family response regulator
MDSHAWSGRRPTQRDFTPRQLDVLVLLCEGLPNKRIGSRLDISPGTVKVHIGQILRKLGVTTRLEAVIAARRGGLFADERDQASESAQILRAQPHA